MTWLDGLSRKLKQAAGRYSYRIDGLSALSEEKVATLKATGRNLFKVTPAQTQLIRDGFARALSAGLDLDAALRTVAPALHALIVRRLETEGGDAGWTQNSDAYRAAKAAQGHDRRTGVRTGTLLRELKAGSVVAVKRGG